MTLVLRCQSLCRGWNDTEVLFEGGLKLELRNNYALIGRMVPVTTIL